MSCCSCLILTTYYVLVEIYLLGCWWADVSLICVIFGAQSSYLADMRHIFVALAANLLRLSQKDAEIVSRGIYLACRDFCLESPMIAHNPAQMAALMRPMGALCSPFRAHV